jgi:CHAD domain-containing protein
MKFKFLQYQDNSTGFRKFAIDKLDTAYNNYKINLIKVKNEFSEENVHDLRVAIRRFISAIDLFSTFYDNYYFKLIKKNIKLQFDNLAMLRDTQVMLITVIKMKLKHPFLFDFLQFLLDKEFQQINLNTEFFSAIKADELDDYYYFLNRALRIDYQPSSIYFEDVKNVILNKYNELLIQKDSVTFDDPKTIHKLRIKTKKFRYLIETLAEVINKPKKVLSVLSNIQTTMGNIQDAEVLLNEFTNFAKKNNYNVVLATLIFDEINYNKQKIVNSLMKEVKILNDLINFNSDDSENESNI